MAKKNYDPVSYQELVRTLHRVYENVDFAANNRRGLEKDVANVLERVKNTPEQKLTATDKAVAEASADLLRYAFNNAVGLRDAMELLGYNIGHITEILKNMSTVEENLRQICKDKQ
jgi:hypothetical protein